jgi:hypothetical protein
MERQASLQRRDRDDVHGTDVEDHIAEILHLAIDEETAGSFEDDRDFLDAYHYPNEGETVG